MALFNQNQQQGNLPQEVMELRGQGLTDNLIVSELTKKGFPADQIQAEISKMDVPAMDYSDAPDQGMQMSDTNSFGGAPARVPSSGTASTGQESALYERIEEITENRRTM